ncbi:protein of unknown function [Chitinophaga costaii]|uniref:DUF4959 domain-containing protein n=1 Tax=Chitinophaga costaii TaxID=1335309 RepID=A0A1C4FKI6_9BACT|nr:DUF4959 domain-containing protein [Chitinophaga costaii]PUZ29997.1 DUF4959 domain-containing protein [Chitinophaga costaii]SCC56344.1 protein of unknown function [Chitinophaga costaii]
MNFLKYIPHGCLLFFLIAALAYTSCKKIDGYNSVVSNDKTKPGVVTAVKVVNFNGGAYITYTLPNSANILYVQANYAISDKATRQTKSSYYSDSITVSGFAASKDYKVVLYTVSRANIKSDSVVVVVHPATPPYQLVYASLVAQNAFGGVNIHALNKTQDPIGIVSLLPDSNSTRLKIQDQHYTTTDAINYTLRGYDTLPKPFAFYVTDQWGNVSDTMYTTVHPIFETLMNKQLFQPYVLPTDVPNYQNGYYNLSNMWNNTSSEPGYNTEQPILASPTKPFIWPAWATFDMGQSARLSRYMCWFRTGGSNEFVWNSGAPETWVLWGREDTPQDEVMPADSTQLPAVGAKTPGGWINMGKFNAPPKPAHNPLTNEDIDTWNAGFNFDLSIDLPKVRYLRLECFHTMGGTDNYFGIMEMSVYGNPQ